MRGLGWKGPKGPWGGAGRRDCGDSVGERRGGESKVREGRVG